MPKWTQEMKDRRKANRIALLMEDLHLNYDEAVEAYLKSFKDIGRKGGSTTGESKVRGGKEYYSTIGRKGVEAKKK